MTDKGGNNEGGKAALSPPYVSFPTFKALLKNFQEHGTPGRIDRSVFPTFSGSIIGQVLPALRFLSLIDAGNHPTDDLKELVGAFGTDEWPSLLKVVLDELYALLKGLDLQTASPSQFDQAFSKAYPGADDVLRKCKTFYLAAAAEAKMPISPYIMRNKKPRSGPAKKRSPRSDASKAGRVKSTQDGEVRTITVHGSKLSQLVLDELDMNKMSEDEQNAVWTFIKFLRKEGK